VGREWIPWRRVSSVVVCLGDSESSSIFIFVSFEEVVID